MAQTFTFIPSKSFTKTTRPRVSVAQFGDGYSQRMQNGINNFVDEWNLVFSSRSVATANSIEQFFIDHAGTDAFYWTPPGDTQQVAVLCPEWSKTYDTAISSTIQAKFVRVFEAI